MERIYLKPYYQNGALLVTSLEARRERLLQSGDREKAQSIWETLDLMSGVQADALITVQGEQQLLGFLALRDERLRDPFAPEEVELLRGLSAQVAITVENSRLYQQTKERDRLAALGSMAAGLAHEIRNPLGSIKGAAQFVEEVVEDEENGDSLKDLLKIIVEEVDRLDRVVFGFLTYARPTSGRPVILKVNDVIRRTVHLFETGRDDQESVDLIVELTEGLPGVRVDGERLHQVFLNLMLNAVQAMKNQSKQGRLEISTRLRAVRVRADSRSDKEASRDYVEIRFADNGPGIEPAILEKIFIPFFTTKEEGSGLGLSVCLRIVRDAGGEIEVRSQVGQGSIFTVVLPAVELTDD
jgi:signal transduction histidine kinase